MLAPLIMLDSVVFDVLSYSFCNIVYATHRFKTVVVIRTIILVRFCCSNNINLKWKECQYTS